MPALRYLDAAARRRRGVQQPLPDRRPQERRWRDLEDLLTLALNAAIALPEMGDRASAVADDLDLDVARARKQPLDIDIAVAERLQRFGAAALHRRRQAGRDRSPTRMPRPPPPAIAFTMIAASGPSDAMNARACSSVVGPDVPGDDRHFVRVCEARAPGPCRRTATSVSGRGPTKVNPASPHARGESGVLAQEAVARDGSASQPASRAAATIAAAVEIGGGTGARDLDGTVRHPRVQRLRVVLANRSRRCAIPISARRAQCGSRSRRDWR